MNEWIYGRTKMSFMRMLTAAHSDLVGLIEDSRKHCVALNIDVLLANTLLTRCECFL